MLDVKDPLAVLGSNLLGVVGGGAAEYFTTWLGLRSLTLIAALFYIVDPNVAKMSV